MTNSCNWTPSLPNGVHGNRPCLLVRGPSLNISETNEMFVRMLTVHCDQSNSYESTINGFQVRKINEIRKRNIQIFLGQPSLNNIDS